MCGAIFAAAGSAELTKACQKIGGCKTGNAVITPGFNLPAKYIIHAVGPVWHGGDKNEPKLLYSAYKQSLIVAKDNGCHSIAFPLISAGIFGYPVNQAWRKALQACMDFIDNNPEYDMQIIFAVIDDNILAIGQQTLAELKQITVSSSKKDISDANTAANDFLAFEVFKQNIKPGRYRHYKGNMYEVIGIATHSETEKPMVVYRALYGDNGLWVRPAEMWFEIVEVDGKQVRRFEPVDEE